MRLQKTGHRESEYERPNQKWVCGWASAGRPCPVGPGPGGRCTAAAQAICSPRKEGDRWVCTRLSVFGGPCKTGPMPDGSCCGPTPTHTVCQPQLGIRARRGRLVASCIALTVGLLTLVLAGPWSTRFVSPGALASVHANVENPQGSGGKCSACHVAGAADVSRWVAAAVGSGTGGHDSDRCLQCHFDGSEPEQARAMFVHGQSPARLALKTQEAMSRGASSTPAPLSIAAMTGAPPVSSRGEIACAVCHREHRGRDHRLTFMDDRRCQACHVVKIGGIADGHPEFGWADRRASWTNFDHVKHQGTHFGDEPFDCGRCHANGVDGRMSLEPFERSCAGCHDQGSSDHHGDRIRAGRGVMIQLPYMEFDEDDVFWPRKAAVSPELTPLMRLLLSGDPSADEALRSLADPDDADTLWSPEEWYPVDETLKVDLADAIKRLIDDLCDAESATLTARLTRATGLPSTRPAVIALADQLRAAAFAAVEFRRLWMVPFDDDSGEPPWMGENLDLAETASGWVLNLDEPAMEYRPLGHADGFLRAWTDVLVEAGNRDDREGDSPTTLPAELLDSVTRGGFTYTTCVRCHITRLDDAAATPRIDWRADGRSAGIFTKFNHTPHLRVAGALQCGHCHQLTESGGDQDGAGSRTDLLAIQRSTCTACHRPGGAPHDCLTCHDYHAHE